MHRGILALALGLTLTAPAQAEYTFRPLSSGNGIGTVNGIVKGDGAGNPSAAVAGTDYVSPALISGRIYVGSAGNLATGVPMGGDCTIVAAGTITCTKINGVTVGSMALQNANTVAITGGTVAVSSATVSTSPGALVTTASFFTPGMSNGQKNAIVLGNSAASNNGFYLAYNHDSTAANRYFGIAPNESGPLAFNITAAGNVGIGTTTPAAKLDVAATAGPLVGVANFFTPGMSNGQKNAIVLGNSAASNNGFYLAYNHDSTAANRYFGIAPNESGPLAFNITAAGNVGIGTTTPGMFGERVSTQAAAGQTAVALWATNDFNGVNTGSALSLTFGAASGNTYAALQASSAGGTSSNALVLQPTGNSVGIGVTAPTANLDIVGSVRFRNYTCAGGGGLLQADGSGNLSCSNSVSGATITSSSVNSTTVGASSASTGKFTTLESTGATTIGSGGGALKAGSTGVGGVSGCLASDGSSPANITAGPCGTGLPGGGTVGQTVLNTASGTGNWFTQQFYNISANASTDCTGVVGTSISTVIGSNTNALIPPGCTVKVSADDSIGSTKTLFVQCGATVTVDNTKTLTINARFIDPGACNIFQGAGIVQGIRDVRPEWFNCDTGTPNYEPCITRAIYSVEHAASSAGDTFRISFQCSPYSYRATLTFTPTSVIPWRGKGCADGSTVLESHSTFSGTSGVVVTNGSDTTVHWIFEGIEFVNKTAGSGATVGITIGGTTAAQIMGGYSRSAFKNGHVSGYATNVLQQNARMINYDNFTSWPNDNSGGIVSSPIGWKLTANLNGFVGDTDWINGSQCTSKNNNVTFTGSTSGSTTLTVSAISAGAITIGMKIVTAIPGAPTVLAQLTGSAGSTGTYQLGQSTTVGSTSMLGVYGTGDCVVMQDDGSNAIHISGIGFEAPFTCYYGATCWKVSITAPGTIFDDFWVSPRVQAESYGNGHALEVTASGSGTLWRNFNMNGIYFAGYGWAKNIYLLNNTSAAAKDLQANNNYFAGTTFEAIDVRGTGGSNCLGITANGNILREPSPDGLASSGIYLENCGSSTVNSNTMEGTVGVVRANIVKFNSGGNYLTCVGNNSGGVTTASGTSNVCVNSAGATQFANGSNQ